MVFLYWTEKTTGKVKGLRLKTGTRIISYAFSVPGWKPITVDEQKGRLPIFVYRIGNAEKVR